MTQHNIAGSEAFKARPIAYIRLLPVRRRRIHPAVWLYLGMAGAGVAAGLADNAIGRPYCILVIVCGLLAWRLWPAR